MKVIYGPVPSWRFGRSLGIDVTPVEEKTCCFDCIYCQLGKTKILTSEKDEYVHLEKIKNELEAINKENIDVITFSGSGEPTLNSKLGEMIIFAKKFGFPVCVLTSAGLINNKEVRKALNNADIVSLKLDAARGDTFQKINRPLEGFSLEKIINGIIEFRKIYKGKLCLQMMFVEENKKEAEEMAIIAKEINADEIQLDTPRRPSKVSPLSKEEMEDIEKYFKEMNYISVYKRKKPMAKAIDIKETLKRRPGLL
ncbi:MAG: radical SAM protein [Candidatus Micrarchaeia archaeon]